MQVEGPNMQVEGTGGVARKTEALRGALQRAIASCDGNPLVDVRTGARHADGRLGGLWNRHILKGYPQLQLRLFYFNLNRN
jgi:hypothetical protein